MTSLRGRGLWIAISLLLFAEKAHQHSYLYDDCTVQKQYDKVTIKTFRSFLNVTISRNRKDAEVTIRIGDQGERETLNLPMNKWTKIGCEYLGNDRTSCSDKILDNTKSSEGELVKEWIITNADVLDNCPLGLPNMELTSDKPKSFPRWENTKENFAVIPEEDMKVTMSISGEEFLFCWDGNTTTINAIDGSCEDLPAHETHKIIVDYDAQEIKSDDGRILKKIRITDNASDALTMKITRGKAWLVQSLGEWPELTGQDTTCDMECICNANGSKEAVLSVLLTLFIATTIALSCCLLRNRRSSLRGLFRPAHVQRVNTDTVEIPMSAGNLPIRSCGEETINDIYESYEAVTTNMNSEVLVRKDYEEETLSDVYEPCTRQ